MSTNNIFYLAVAAGNYEYATDILAAYMRNAGYSAALNLVESIKTHPAFSVSNQYERTIQAGVLFKAQLQLNPPILQKNANNVLTRGYHLTPVLIYDFLRYLDNKKSLQYVKILGLSLNFGGEAVGIFCVNRTQPPQKRTVAN